MVDESNPSENSASLVDFDYELPAHRIAQHPVEPRDSARLLVAGAETDILAHHRVAELDELLEPGDVVVVNDTKVLAARLVLQKITGGRAEVLLLEPTPDLRRWQALVRPGRRLPAGTVLYDEHERPLVTVGEAVDGSEDGRREVELADGAMEQAGQVPLPPYITEPLADPDRYQTVFARNLGSVAAPTAGLHLTPELLERLSRRDIAVERIELRVGLGTFRPISVERIADHQMHAERYVVQQEVWDRIRAAKRVVAVGTTVVRTLESVASGMGTEGETSLFITAGYKWNRVDVLLTNFHVPKSSLLVLVDAFIGDRWRSIYQEALDTDYRFLSFGDAMLLTRAANGAEPGNLNS